MLGLGLLDEDGPGVVDRALTIDGVAPAVVFGASSPRVSTTAVIVPPTRSSAATPAAAQIAALLPDF